MESELIVRLARFEMVSQIPGRASNTITPSTAIHIT